jgi:hypothetical protein
MPTKQDLLRGRNALDPYNTNRSITIWTLKAKPFVLSLSMNERFSASPFDKLRVNGTRGEKTAV